MLIIVADDLGFADVGFNGATFATPSIDRIARTGMVLDRFYNSPLCSPSRAGMPTGRYPHRYGIMGDTLLGAAVFDTRRSVIKPEPTVHSTERMLGLPIGHRAAIPPMRTAV